MSDAAERTFTGDFRRFFLRGLVVLLPTVLTLWIVVKAYQFVHTNIAVPINRGIQIAMINTARVWEPLREPFDPTSSKLQQEVDRREQALEVTIDPMVVRGDMRAQAIRDWWDAHWYMDLIGIFVAIISVYIAGRLLGGFFGRQIYRRLEVLITSLPVFKQVYPYVKQIVDFLFSDDQPIKFNRVVAVEYPRKGVWSVGFQTGSSLRSIQQKLSDSVTVFIPSSPTPFTGYTITIARSDVIELPLSVDEAIRFAVSGGVLIPEHQTLDPSEELGRTGLRPLPGGDAAPGEAARGGNGADGPDDVREDRPAGPVPDDPESTSGSATTPGNRRRNAG